MEARPDKSLRLAVLPSISSSGESREEDYFSRGFLEDLITDLSRFPNLELISSHSSLDPRLKQLSEREIGEALDASLLLKTNVRKQEDKIRLSAQLVDAATGSVLWAERYDADYANLFELQDKLVEKITSTLSQQIDISRLESVRHKPVTELAAYDCWLRGLEKLREGTLPSDEEARDYFEQALKIDPNYARAYVGLSLSHFNEWSCQNWDLSEISECGAFQYAQKAAQLDRNDHIAHLVLGRVHLFRREFEKCRQHIRRAYELNPNDADQLIQIAACHAFLGEFEMAEKLYQRAITLNPYCDPWYYAYGGFIEIMQGKLRDGIQTALKAPLTTVWIDLAAFIALAYGHLDDAEEAAVYKQIFYETFQEKITKGEPPETGEPLNWLLEVNPFARNKDREFYLQGLQKAGFEHKPAPELKGDAQSSKVESPGQPDHEDLCIFREENGTRTIEFEGLQTQLPEIKGFGDIEKLFTHQEEEIHCTDLMGTVSETAKSDEVLDSRARGEIASRIRELQNELSEAEEVNDPGSVEKIREELDPLLDYLANSVGIGGRTRKLNAPAEKARTAVTWRIRNAIGKITDAHPPLGKHLQNSVRTGAFCSYSPERPVSWQV